MPKQAKNTGRTLTQATRVVFFTQKFSKSYMMQIQFTSKKEHAQTFGQIGPSGKKSGKMFFFILKDRLSIVRNALLIFCGQWKVNPGDMSSNRL